jgi:acyl-coenzyme A thioesterase PaaI-like protein
VSLRNRLLLRWMSVYPPYLGAGVRVSLVGRSPLAFETRMKLRWWNRNYVGTHYGGSLYTMCDPFFMLILIAELGPEFTVWDKAATIRFRRPGRGEVRARFAIAPARVEEIRRQAQVDGKAEPSFTAQVVDAAGEVVAEVDKLLSVRLRRPEAARSAAAGATR